MSTINNSELTKELIQGAKLNTSGYEQVPTQLAEKVVPVMEVNPKLLATVNIIKNATAEDATSATIWTTPTDKDFYLTALSFALVKDATATTTRATMTIVQDGETKEIAVIWAKSLTILTTDNLFFNFVFPIKIDRGTIIGITNTTNVGKVLTTGVIYGYLVANSNV